MFAFQHSNPYAFPIGQPVQSSPSFYPRQLSKVELLRAQLAQAEQEAALARQRRFDDILEEERLRALARRQVEEEEKEARIRRAIVLQQQEQARQRALQQQVEEQKRIRLARAFQEERLRVYRAEQRKLLEHLFGGEESVEEPKSAVPHYTSDAPLKRKQAIRRQSADIKEPQPKTQESVSKPDDAHTIVVDLADIFSLLSEPKKASASKSEPTKPEPKATTSSTEQAEASTSVPASAIKRSPSVESRPDLLAAQTTAAPTETSEPQKDIAGSLAAIEAIASGFDQLVAEFSFPSTLDFTPPSSRNASRASNFAASDDEGDSSSISKLAYTSNNAPLRVFENAASKMLNLLDAVDSFGDAELRKARKGVVERVEGKLEEIEREVSRRWRGWSDAKGAAVTSEEKPDEEVVADSQPQETTSSEELALSPAVELQEHLPSQTETSEDSELVTVDAAAEAVFAVEPSSIFDGRADAHDTTALPTPENNDDTAVLVESVADLEATVTLAQPVSAAAYSDTESDSESEPFLSTLPQDEEPSTRRHVDEKVEDSDWSEVEA